jgi:hypothetical protein
MIVTVSVFLLQGPTVIGFARKDTIILMLEGGKFSISLPLYEKSEIDIWVR